MNYLNAVFWDYPQFTEERYLRRLIQNRDNIDLYLWILKRFLEHGRVVDTLAYFSLQEIVRHLPNIRLKPETMKKWKRILEVYARS